MTDAGAKALAEAISRLAVAIEKLAGMGATSGGIHVYHHDSKATWGPAHGLGGSGGGGGGSGVPMPSGSGGNGGGSGWRPTGGSGGAS
jgi:hypothetical protein